MIFKKPLKPYSRLNKRKKREENSLKTKKKKMKIKINGKTVHLAVVRYNRKPYFLLHYVWLMKPRNEKYYKNKIGAEIRISLVRVTLFPPSFLHYVPFFHSVALTPNKSSFGFSLVFPFCGVCLIQNPCYPPSNTIFFFA